MKKIQSEDHPKNEDDAKKSFWIQTANKNSDKYPSEHEYPLRQALQLLLAWVLC